MLSPGTQINSVLEMRNFWQNFLRGVGSISSLFPNTAQSVRLRRPAGMATGNHVFVEDWTKISGDFQRVLRRVGVPGETPFSAPWNPTLTAPTLKSHRADRWTFHPDGPRRWSLTRN